jgi:hypothetical protein
LLSLENVAAKEEALFTGQTDPLAPSVKLIGVQSLKTRQTFDSIRRNKLRLMREILVHLFEPFCGSLSHSPRSVLRKNFEKEQTLEIT